MGKKEHCKEELKMIILNGKQGKQIIVDGSTVKIIKKGGIFDGFGSLLCMKILNINTIFIVTISKRKIAFKCLLW